jgi:hypothetical protein
MRRLFGLMTAPAAAGGIDATAMIAEGEAAIAGIEARRRERWERNAARRAQGREAYERANREHAARYGPGLPPVTVAASLAWLDEPAPVRVW